MKFMTEPMKCDKCGKIFKPDDRVWKVEQTVGWIYKDPLGVEDYFEPTEHTEIYYYCPKCMGEDYDEEE